MQKQQDLEHQDLLKNSESNNILPTGNMSRAPLTTEFGESNLYDDEGVVRLNYNQPQYRDVVFAILYYVHVAVVVAAGGYLWFTKYPDITGSDSDSGSNSDDIFADVALTGVFVAIGGCLLAGIVFGLCWLEIMKRFAAQIIWTMLLLNVGLWAVVAVVGVVTNVLPLVIIGLLLALLNALYAFCVRSRIPFASALLAISSSITSSYGGTVFISVAVIVFDALWVFLWGSMVYAYIIVFGEDINSVMLFLMLVSFYWGFQVNTNISHCTSCGVAATWFFSTAIDYNPTPRAFKRTMTTSFGSVALGSLMVAVIQAMKAMVNSARNNNNGLVRCLVLCLLDCLERLVEYFNTYAYAHCAIYGTSFVASAKMTWNLFKSRGVMAIINDDLTGMVLFAGAMIGGVVTAAVGFGIGYAFYSDSDDGLLLAAYLAATGLLIGMILTMTTLYVVRSSVVALFVCFAEEPAAMQQNRPQEFQQLTGAKPELQTFYDEYTTGSGQRNEGPRV